jgi:hypothetical protein
MEVFEASPTQLVKVGLVTAVVAVQAVGLAVAAVPLAAESGWLLAAALVVYGVACLVGMGVYAACYVRSIALGAEGPDGPRTLEIRTLWPGAALRLRESDLQASRDYAGQAIGRGIRVDAPWTTVHIRGRRPPLLIDGQGRWSSEGASWFRRLALRRQGTQ